ncbi:DUF6011 domain-containing protein [Embleya sp. NPDC127516]|uniref:DUF6011 domain-containing protein n=1 Tax=Embleya sp. NPDC127516 TaxID=3363990 RepID=UPI003806A74A
MTPLPDGYYAVLDPTNATTMTYWRVATGRLKPWPARATYGPRFLRRDAPPRGDNQAWITWATTCAATRAAWTTALVDALTAEPVAAQARFAALTTRCCSCGRALTDPDTKTGGIGPECRRDVPDAVLVALADAVARAHAATLTTPGEPA